VEIAFDENYVHAACSTGFRHNSISMTELRIVYCLEKLPEDQLSSTYANIRDSHGTSADSIFVSAVPKCNTRKINIYK
jgi:hypothetical protein